MNIGNQYIPTRFLFSLLMVVIVLALWVFRKPLITSYINHPLKRIFLKVIQVIVPSIFMLMCSYWLKQTRGHFDSALTYVIIPFFITQAVYFVLLSWAEHQVSVKLAVTTKDREEEKQAYEFQIKSLSQIVALEGYLQNLVKSKAKRFLDFYRQIKAGKMESDSVDKNNIIFKEITQPQEQLTLMVGLTHEYFEKYIVPANYQCNVTVMTPDGDKLKFVYAKDTPRSMNKPMYYYGNSAAGKCWMKGDILIIPNKQEELQLESGRAMYVQGERPFSEDGGSLICYPIFDFGLTPSDHKSALIYIINITSTKPNNFLEQDEAHYKKILGSLAERMILENRLIKIKEVVGKTS